MARGQIDKTSEKSKSSKSFFATFTRKKSAEENNNTKSETKVVATTNSPKTAETQSIKYTPYKHMTTKTRAATLGKLEKYHEDLKSEQELKQSKIEDITVTIQNNTKPKAKEQGAQEEFRRISQATDVVEEKTAKKNEKNIETKSCNNNITMTKKSIENVPINIELINRGLIKNIRDNALSTPIEQLIDNVEKTIDAIVANINADKKQPLTNKFLKKSQLEHVKTEIINKLSELSKNLNKEYLDRLFPAEDMPPQKRNVFK